MKYTSGSKKFAWAILGVATLLTAFAIFKDLEGVGVAVWSTGIPSAAALYANKQFQDRKKAELDKK